MAEQQKRPTHILVLEIPVIMSGDHFEQTILREMLETAVATTKAALDGIVCDTITIALQDTSMRHNVFQDQEK